jgi:hypothetical protein
VSEFVEECRREWRRLGVPDPVANEMAADLTADLDEAEAEGGTPEDVLGNSAFDPRRFAAAWAAARGVTGPPIPDRPSLWRPPVAIALTVLLGVLTVGAGLVLLVGTRGHSFAIATATRRIVAGPGPIRIFPGPGRIAVPGPLGPFVGTQIAGAGALPIALALLIVGVVGLVLLAVLYWSPWSGIRRFHRHGGRRTQSWN